MTCGPTSDGDRKRNNSLMKVSVVGLWHLGAVTAACLAEHFPTIGIDPDQRRLRVPLLKDRVETLTATVRALQEAGIVVADIGLHRPTLDEAFLQLTASPSAVAA